MIEFDVAEVLEYNATYQYIDPITNPASANNSFAIYCRSCSTYYNLDPIIVKPSDINMKRIPLVGEYVLIYRSYNQNATHENRKYQSWYYLTTIDLQSNINANILPGISKKKTDSEIQSYKPGKTFKLPDSGNSISPLQPYEGDFILEGRFGNSIRFGSTVDLNGSGTTDFYTVQSPWKGSSGNQGDPIIVMSNGRQNLPRKQFTSESIQNDASSLYLTSTQTLPSFKLGNSENPNPLSCFYPGESAFNRSQLIGVADRIILKAKTDIVVIDSPRGIVLNTTGEVRIGSDEGNESMVHGDVLLNVLQKILNQLNSPIQCGTMTGTFIDKSYTVSAQKQLQDLLSSTYFIKKNTY